MWKPYICPKFSRLKKAPIPIEFSASLPWAAIHCALKLVIDRYPVKAVPMAARKISAPETQVNPRPWRQAPLKKATHRCSVIEKKNTSAHQKWRLFTKWPKALSCHHCGPKAASRRPERIKRTRLHRESTPKK